MLSNEYKKAAKRHLQTCFELIKILTEKNLKKELLLSSEMIGQPFSPFIPEDEYNLLSNIYYLSGYVIECIYNYAIYKHIGFTSVDVSKLKSNSTTYNVSCYPPKKGRAKFIMPIKS